MRKNKKNLVFIINSNSRHCDTEFLVREIKRGLNGYSYIFKFPESIEASLQICNSLDARECDAVIVAGGDGTINRTLPGLVGKNIPIYVLPCGNSNSLASYVGSSSTVPQMQRLLDTKSYAPIDLIVANDAMFATVGGIGLGGVLASEMSENRKNSILFNTVLQLMEHQIYRFLTAKAIYQGRERIHRVRLTMPEGAEVMDTAAIFIANQPQFGQRAILAPEARNNDGKFEVLVLKASGKKELYKSLMSLRKGAIPENAARFSTNHLVVDAIDHYPLPVFGDGEPLANNTRVEFKILPNAISVFTDVHGNLNSAAPLKDDKQAAS